MVNIETELESIWNFNLPLQDRLELIWERMKEYRKTPRKLYSVWQGKICYEMQKRINYLIERGYYENFIVSSNLGNDIG